MASVQLVRFETALAVGFYEKNDVKWWGGEVSLFVKSWFDVVWRVVVRCGACQLFKSSLFFSFLSVCLRCNVMWCLSFWTTSTRYKKYGANSMTTFNTIHQALETHCVHNTTYLLTFLTVFRRIITKHYVSMVLVSLTNWFDIEFFAFIGSNVCRWVCHVVQYRTVCGYAGSAPGTGDGIQRPKVDAIY